ncbi:hydroxypyruvate isomerase [Glaciimonas sp. CA11.2]|uniref:hydroxypyruvate isomerase n=1 Tax=unclassified Glaciimonas TaxID=2644401 RepID=UPI002AB3CDBD|nr:MULTISPECIES: hydroxypyruvate isomerase [unclassified Glaciimonas]MDY7547198.1 hydroxypyruvate isomerase [Glaciimonas sp. CA11.2]MEB0014429.1 hydroxypyruvate isomerase [Glaciimonas sp. Cout2]MEB0083311.1 hydroxypyruvate isomerase [Glaciimonas sp. Gout2]MEB0163424.1 hydroxypyruvate isomerase [Glaciimonas sp. CA11.2]
MTKLAANLTMLFTELPFLERFGAAATAGFKGVEFLFPYAFRAEEISDKLQTNGLELVLHNLPAGNWEAGERGIACHPDRISEFKEGIDEALRYAKILGVKQLNCLVGIAPSGVSAEELKATVVSNLTFAADKFQAAGIRLLIEPINTFDIPGFYLSGTQQALDLIAATGSGNIFVQYDIYHMQRMEGELANTIKANLPRIAHIQLADNPGRFEPGTGEINYRFLFSFLDEIGYDGWIGCEYKPKAGTVDGLGWRTAHGL